PARSGHVERLSAGGGGTLRLNGPASDGWRLGRVELAGLAGTPVGDRSPIDTSGLTARVTESGRPWSVCIPHGEGRPALAGCLFTISEGAGRSDGAVNSVLV